MEEESWEVWEKILKKKYIWKCKEVIRENKKGRTKGEIITEVRKEWVGKKGIKEWMERRIREEEISWRVIYNSGGIRKLGESITERIKIE